MQLTDSHVVTEQAQTVMKQMLQGLGKQKDAPENVGSTWPNKI